MLAYPTPKVERRAVVMLIAQVGVAKPDVERIGVVAVAHERGHIRNFRPHLCREIHLDVAVAAQTTAYMKVRFEKHGVPPDVVPPDAVIEEFVVRETQGEFQFPNNDEALVFLFGIRRLGAHLQLEAVVVLIFVEIVAVGLVEHVNQGFASRGQHIPNRGIASGEPVGEIVRPGQQML